MKRIKLFEEFINESAAKLLTVKEFIGDGVESEPRFGKTMAEAIQKYFKLPLDKILVFEYDINDPEIISYTDSITTVNNAIVWEVEDSHTDIRNRSIESRVKVTAHKWLTSYDTQYKLLTLDCIRSDGEDEYGYMMVSQEGLIALSIEGIIPWESWASPAIIHKYRGRTYGRKYGIS